MNQLRFNYWEGFDDTDLKKLHKHLKKISLPGNKLNSPLYVAPHKDITAEPTATEKQLLHCMPRVRPRMQQQLGHLE